MLSVGGFYEFRFLLKWGSFANPEAAILQCRLLNNGSDVFKVADR
ncbi:hypothetical protein [Paenibacillus sp. R14(2021)]|nr:hypothetical protein [Paenibacillus sp. R14(2021)]